MKRRTIFLKKILVFFLVYILIISISSMQKIKDKNVKNNIESNNITEPINNEPPKSSNYWFLDGPQNIVGHAGWSKPWISGSGTADNPYLIENVVIDGHWTWNCLSIEDSYKYFKIINCTFIRSTGGNFGLDMISVENGTIINSYFESNLGNGIRLSNCFNITIRDSFITNNTLNGILFNYCENINIIGNTIKNNTLGVNLTEYAMNNLIYRNKFINNLNHAHDNGSYSPNQWNSTTIGNYWDNYTGSDINGDCIGEDAQKIPGIAGSFDYHPLLLCYGQKFYGDSENDDDDDDDNEKSNNILDKVLHFIKTPIGIGIVAGAIIVLLVIIVIIKKR